MTLNRGRGDLFFGDEGVIPLTCPTSHVSLNGEMTEVNMRTLLAITKALADQNRIRILAALHGSGELCVCQIQELLGLAASSTSKHLSILASAGLVEVRKEGRWAHYRITDRGEIPQEAGAIVDWICTQSASQKVIVEDCEKLEAILAISPEELCQRQAQGIRCCSTEPATPTGAN